MPRDRAILIACMVISLFFWLLIKLSDRYTAQKRLDLDVALSEGRAFRNGTPGPLTVEVEGTGWDLLFSYFGKKDSLSYDLLAEEAEELSPTRLQNDISAHFAKEDLVVQRLNDEDLDLTLEETLMLRVPVVLRDSLRFAPGYQLLRPIGLEPDSVALRGPRSAVEGLSQWPTKVLKGSDLKTSQKRELFLETPGAGVTLSPRQVTATIEVEQMTEKSLFVGLDVLNAPPNDSLHFFPQRVRVRCVVGLSQYQQIDSADFRLVADLRDVQIEQGENTVPIQLTRQPSEVRNVTFSPEAAKFYIVKRDPDDSENE